MERSREFVQALQRELPAWQADGVVTSATARALAARYGLAPPPPVPRDRSPRLAVTGGIAVVLALAVALVASGISDGVLLPVLALAAAYAAGPLAVRGDALAPAAQALRNLGRVIFYLVAYALSFEAVAEAARFRSGVTSEGLVAALPPLLLAAGAVACGLRRQDLNAHTRGEAMLLVATVVAFAAGLSLDTGKGTALVATMALAFLAAGRIVRGISWTSRASFVEGIAVAAVIVASRAFDVFPSIWIAVGAVTGSLLVAAAALVGFERHRARGPDAHADPAAPVP